MGDMFRSEKMSLCQLFIPPEAAYITLAELGESGCIQFRDLNSAQTIKERSYYHEVLRCDELLLRLKNIELQAKRDGIKMNNEYNEPAALKVRDLNELEAQIENLEQELNELKQNGNALRKNYRELIEQKLILEHASEYLTDTPYTADANNIKYLDYVAGVMKLERFFAFERMLWRLGHGNIFIKRKDIAELNENANEIEHEQVKRVVFIAYFQGEQLKQRVLKVCAGFHVANYQCTNLVVARETMLNDLKIRLADLELVLNQTIEQRRLLLSAAAEKLHDWIITLKKMQAIYHILNYFNQNISNKCLVAEGWTPTKDLHILKAVLERGSKLAASSMPAFINVLESTETETPPTYFRTNKFTKGFQNLTDAYGMATYREVNPSLYSCITFPFLFAVMYGDLGHGFILLLVALFLVLKEKQLAKIKEEVFNIFFTGRYIILLMGLFSMYTGLIYNDIFSKSMNIFGSGWQVNENVTDIFENRGLDINPKDHAVATYTLGIDPVWNLAGNKILFLNSFKMKISIIFGVVHMLFGLSMSCINYIHLKKRLNIIFDFIPQVLFLLFIFGYLVFMIFYKFVMYSDKSDDFTRQPGCAPNLLVLFINMMMFSHTKPNDGCNEYLFEGQNILQIVFVVLALLCIPWMLLAKPFYQMHQRKKAAQLNASQQNNTIDLIENNAAMQDVENMTEEEPISELFILQAIHTIEYVLSSVSHTASYLRLWALSLAHQQLSDVLWVKLLSLGFVLPLGYANGILIYFLFYAWSFLTVSILVIIEGLSAFLHTLRLHWVEFNNKFYKGEGYAYEPFSFKTLLEPTEE